MALGEDHNNVKMLLAECPEIDIVVKGSNNIIMTNNPLFKKDPLIVGTEHYPRTRQRRGKKGTAYIITSFGFSKYMGVANILVSVFDRKKYESLLKNQVWCRVVYRTVLILMFFEGMYVYPDFVFY